MFDWPVPQRISIPVVSNHIEYTDGVDWTAVGKIYEHLACFYLSSVGFKADLKDRAGYDILCETPDGCFFKVEVKSSRKKCRTAGSSRCRRIGGSYTFGGMKTKNPADMFIFFDRATNYAVVRLREEMGSIANNYEIGNPEFSEYYTNYHFNRIRTFTAPNPLTHIFPDHEEKLKLNRDWVRDNVNIIHEMKSFGIWQSRISKLFDIGDVNWIRRICREDRNT